MPELEEVVSEEENNVAQENDEKLRVVVEKFVDDIIRDCLVKAEEIKIKYASAMASLSSEKLDFEYDTEDKNQTLSENELSKYVEARMEEIFQLAKNEINRAGINNTLTYGAVLTGGGSQLRNIIPLAKNLLDMPIRLGKPVINLSLIHI